MLIEYQVLQGAKSLQWNSVPQIPKEENSFVVSLKHYYAKLFTKSPQIISQERRDAASKKTEHTSL